MQRRSFLKGTAGLVALSTIGSTRLAMAQGATIKVGVPIPTSGPGGMFGTPCKNVAEMALAEINARGGIAGRPLELVYIDAGTAPADVAQAALKAWQGDGVEAFVGFHDSGVRGALNSVFQGQVPYVYCSLYEGGECSNGIVVMGETPTQQLQPVVPWLAKELGVSKWYLIGNDYNWPRDTFTKAKDYIAAAGGTVVGEEYVPFTVDNFDSSVAKIKESGADMVLMTLVGGSAVAFNRAFGSFGLGATVMRSSPGCGEFRKPLCLGRLLQHGPDRRRQGLYREICRSAWLLGGSELPVGVCLRRHAGAGGRGQQGRVRRHCRFRGGG
jgi:ABC-type branched-subunit amino acid transport system substrate-binding protein